jgi:hypothetical protein
MLTTKELIAKYGAPNPEGTYLVTINLPYAFLYDGKPVKRMRCHKLVADKFLAVFNDILAHYGLEEINRLRNKQIRRMF